jgi:threonylcarbamoyladenosine tRNA methylthiotransferase MtaB
LDRVLRQINSLAETGYREVVISGINLGRWGRDLRERTTRSATFEYLIRKILSETAIEKLRISSVEPMDWSDAVIQLMASSPRIAKHAHVPMQSGSDRVLRLMHRKYRPWHYRDKISRIRSAMPNAAIGADVMVGFPGETEADFEATRRMIEELPLTYLHVFTYSSRPGTPSATMPAQVPVHVARERNEILRDLSAQKRLAFMKMFVGESVEAITLRSFDGEYTEALTDNYLKLRLKGKYEANRKVLATVKFVNNEALVA